MAYSADNFTAVFIALVFIFGIFLFLKQCLLSNRADHDGYYPIVRQDRFKINFLKNSKDFALGI
jgi:hypothetical protein